MTAGPRTIVLAAGAVTFRSDPAGATEVLLVHRPRYNDWSLPKGTLDEDELTPAAAVREVAEETGFPIRLGAPLDPVAYPVAGMRPGTEKSVSWWRADLVPAPGADTAGVSGNPSPHGDSDHLESASGRAVPDRAVAGAGSEVDQTAWLDVVAAATALSYDSDRAVLDQALQQPATTPVVLVRHAKAVNRKDWDADDADRPLRPRGRTQARRLAPLLDAYGVKQLVSSPWFRCAATLQPYGVQRRLPTQTVDVFNEDAGKQDPAGVQQAMIDICERAVVEQRPVAVCGHRPVIPDMLAALDVPARKLATAECVIAHLDGTGTLHAVEWHRPRA